MANIYFYLLIGICVSIVLWGIVKLERVYQYPFFMVLIFISFILPQANSLVENAVSDQVVTENALTRVLFYTSMCVAMCWVGYLYNPENKWLTKLDIPIDQRKLTIAGGFFLAIGYFCNFSLSQITIEKGANGNWTGPATILVFFAGLIYIALPIFLLKSIAKPNPINISLAILAAVPILQTIILGGRRQPTMTFLIAVGLSFFIAKRYVPPRGLFIVGAILAAYIIPVLGSLRGEFWNLLFSGDWQTVVDSSQEALDKVTEGKILELRNAAIMMDASEQFSKYGFGTGFWDALVFQFVPGQLLGFEFKQSLQLNLAASDLGALYGYSVSSGSTTTGIGDSFTELSYFGCLIFGLIGCMFKTLWVSAINRGSLFGGLLYIALISPAMVGITHGIGRFCQEFVFQVGSLCLAAYFCREKKVQTRKIHNS